MPLKRETDRQTQFSTTGSPTLERSVPSKPGETENPPWASGTTAWIQSDAYSTFLWVSRLKLSELHRRVRVLTVTQLFHKHIRERNSSFPLQQKPSNSNQKVKPLQACPMLRSEQVRFTSSCSFPYLKGYQEWGRGLFKSLLLFLSDLDVNLFLFTYFFTSFHHFSSLWSSYFCNDV